MAEREAKSEPNGVTDDGGRKTMALVGNGHGKIPSIHVSSQFGFDDIRGGEGGQCRGTSRVRASGSCCLVSSLGVDPPLGADQNAYLILATSSAWPLVAVLA